jgi:hypothetical protein
VPLDLKGLDASVVSRITRWRMEAENPEICPHKACWKDVDENGRLVKLICKTCRTKLPIMPDFREET